MIYKAETHMIFVAPAVAWATFTQGVLWAQLLLQFYTDCFETLQLFIQF